MKKLHRSIFWLLPRKGRITGLTALFLLLSAAMTTASQPPCINVSVDSTGIRARATDSAVTWISLRVAGPRGILIANLESESGAVAWSPPAGSAAGPYTWEVVAGFGPRNRMRGSDDGGSIEPVRPWRQSGTVTIRNGAIVPPNQYEGSRLQSVTEVMQAAWNGIMDFLVAPAAAAQVIAEDLIVQGSECLGGDCPGAPAFGFDTLLLMENNLRIKFDDTSAMAGFAANDWSIVINDSTNGGGDYFGIQDDTNATMPFRIEAGAPTNSFYVGDYGRIGLGTAVPALELHVLDGDTPAVRLEQDGSSGWTPQTWDVAGNETNFFIRDVTNGSTLPLRIKPGTPSSTLCLTPNGVGIGTWTPGPDRALSVVGNAYVSGNLELGSSRELKENIRPLEAAEAMETLKALDPVRYNYKSSPDEDSLGFIAEEVPDLVATKNRQSLSPMDVVAVLTKVTQQQQKSIEELTRRLAELEKQLEIRSQP